MKFELLQENTKAHLNKFSFQEICGLQTPHILINHKRIKNSKCSQHPDLTTKVLTNYQ